MKSTQWITEHDLTLVFDRTGRLWSFRPTTAYAAQPAATVVDDALVVSVDAPGILPGDLDVQADGDVLRIRGIGAARNLSWDVGLPVATELDRLETYYHEDRFEVRLPMIAAATTDSLEQIAVAV